MSAHPTPSLKPLSRIHAAPPPHWVGNGFYVRSVFSYNDSGEEMSPFLLMDYAEPREFRPGETRRGVGRHPHKGFETVTIVYQGELEHKDSSGGGGIIGPGDVQWMTAGKGILHEEYHARDFSRKGGFLQMVQLWVNLRARDKSVPPAYQTLRNADIPLVTISEGRGAIRVIAGDFAGHAGPANTHSPINLWDIVLNAGASAHFPLEDGHGSALFLLEGSCVLADGTPLAPAELAIFRRQGEGIAVEATRESRLLLLDGEPINDPIVGYGPFVMNTREELAEAFEQFRDL